MPLCRSPPHVTFLTAVRLRQDGRTLFTVTRLHPSPLCCFHATHLSFGLRLSRFSHRHMHATFSPHRACGPHMLPWTAHTAVACTAGFPLHGFALFSGRFMGPYGFCTSDAHHSFHTDHTGSCTLSFLFDLYFLNHLFFSEHVPASAELVLDVGFSLPLDYLPLHLFAVRSGFCTRRRFARFATRLTNATGSHFSTMHCLVCRATGHT